MPQYEYRGSGVFYDNRNDREIEHGDVVELDESVVGNHAFRRVETETDEENAEDSAQTPDEDTEDTPLEEKEYQELRDMATEADTDEINGRSSKDEIIAYFSE